MSYYCVSEKNIAGKKEKKFQQFDFRSVTFNLLQSLTLKEASKVVLSILKEVMEEKLSATNVEVSI